jgi:hypothetical protein
MATHRWNKNINNPQPQHTYYTAIAKNQQPTVADSGADVNFVSERKDLH